MNSRSDLIAAMAQKCREIIEAAPVEESGLPADLRPAHLLWMCDRIERHASNWPEVKLHRWLGFLQGAMLAHRMVDLFRAKSMFDEAKRAFLPPNDRDLLDHLDPDSAFELELGGES